MHQLLWQWTAFAVFLFSFSGNEAPLPGPAAPLAKLLIATPQYLGSGLSADALSNTRIGGPYQTTTSFGFRATHSGLLASVRLYVIWSNSSSGYNGGTGGSLLVRIQPDDGTSRHRPSGQTLASYTHTDPMNKGSFPLLTFPSPVQLRKGTIYHVVITNPDADPATNYVSVNSLWMRKGLIPCQPTLVDSDWFQLLGSRTNPASWTNISTGQSDSFTPILALNYMDGFSDGVGYMEVWTENPKVVSGTSAVRQLFTMTAADQSVAQVSVRLKRRSGTDSLIAQIQTAAGVTVARGALASSKVGTAYSWVTIPMGNKLLGGGQKYMLEFRSAATSTYDLYPIRKGSGSSVEFKPALFIEGYAQFTTGGAWRGWDQWWQADRRDGDLQYYLTFTPDPPAAPVLRYPLNGAIDVPAAPDLIWYGSAGASSYHVQVSADSLFGSTMVFNDSTIADTTVHLSVLAPHQRYFWRVRALNAGGSSPHAGPSVFRTSGNTEDTSTVQELQIEDFHIYPNPFKSRTTVSYVLTAAGTVAVEVVNALGAHVATVHSSYQAAGPHTVEWIASGIPAGAYFCRIRCGSASAVKGMRLVR